MTKSQICLVVTKVKPNTADELGRRERKRAETLEKLFQAAVQMFAKKGFAATKVEDITEAADVAKGTFFNYFPSKEHILMYFAGRQIGKVEACLASVQKEDGPIEPKLRALAHDLLSTPSRTPELARCMMGSFMGNEEVRTFVHDEIAGRGRRTLARILEIGQKRGELRRDVPPYELARVFQQTMFGTMLMWTMNPSEPFGGIVDRTLSVLWGGMRGEAGKKK